MCVTLEDNNSTSIIQDQGLALILTEAGGGTKVSTTRNILYGNISASIKTVGAVGVVTAFITMSGTKDEIDWGARSSLLGCSARRGAAPRLRVFWASPAHTPPPPMQNGPLAT